MDGDPPRLRVLAWGEAHRRDLPWRRTRDPWAVLVSELMLQQTQVARVLPRYLELLERFPTPAACAAARPGDVVRCWAGLGYNRRALNLHAAACMIMQEGGRFPDTLAGLVRLPGVGSYTARAVLAFAFERDVAVVDTNVARVLARVVGRTLRPAEAQATADQWLVRGEAWAWNQALLDVGATVCRARAVDCAACPLREGCAWQRAGTPPPDPATGSAFVSGGQAPFTGSDREGRGRLVDALRRGPVPWAEVATVAGWPLDAGRAERVAARLVADGLAVRHGDLLHLP